MGHSITVNAAGSNPAYLGSNPSAPANTPVYVDDDTGAVVDEAWWPGDPVPNQYDQREVIIPLRRVNSPLAAGPEPNWSSERPTPMHMLDMALVGLL